MYRDYDNVQRWGIPRITSFAISKTTHEEFCIEYESCYNNIINSCRLLMGNWSVTLCLRGRYSDVAKPTVVIIHSGIPDNWTTPDTGFLPLELIAGKVERYQELYEEKVDSSACIGCSLRHGTFGGYLKSNANKVYGLTCGHVVFGEEMTPFKNLDSIVFQPSPYHVGREIEDSTTDLQLTTNIEEQNIISNGISELNAVASKRFGVVVCGEVSAENPQSPTTDWALINVDDQRTGENRIPKSKTSTVKIVDLKVCDLETATKVWKKGHISGLTSGSVNGLKSRVKMDGIESTERTVMGKFADRGDSGSWVASYNGVCGIIIGGSAEEHISYVSDFNTVLRRIKEKAGLELYPTN